MPWNSTEAFQFTQNQEILGKKLPRKCLWNQISSREELSILIFPWRRVHTGFTAASLETIGTSKRCLWQQNAEVFAAGEGIQQCQHYMQLLSPEQPFSSSAVTVSWRTWLLGQRKGSTRQLQPTSCPWASGAASSVYSFTKTWAG